jgi:hypothetical protein
MEKKELSIVDMLFEALMDNEALPSIDGQEKFSGFATMCNALGLTTKQQGEIEDWVAEYGYLMMRDGFRHGIRAFAKLTAEAKK